MAKEELDIVIKVTDEASREVKNISKNVDKSFDNVKKKSNALRLSFIAAGTAVAAFSIKIGVDAVKQAVKFEKQMSNISTLLGKGEKVSEDFTDGISNLIRTMAIDADDIGTAAYDIFSAGVTDANEALNVLQASSQLAIAGLGSVSSATDLMTSAINAFASEGLSATEIADIMFTTVKNGKTTVEELAQTFGATAPIMAEAGVALSDFQASTAALTTVGLSASIAQTQLRQAVVALIKPTGDMSDLFDKIGVKTGEELIQTSEGLGEAFTKIRDAAEGNNAVLGKALGSVEALNAVISIAGSTSESYILTLDDMTDGVNSLTEAWLKQTDTADAQFQLLQNNLTVILRDLGGVILPTVVEVLGEFTKFLKQNEEQIKLVLKVVASFVSTALKLMVDMLRAGAIVIGSVDDLFMDMVSILKAATKGMKAFLDIAVMPAIDALNTIFDIASKVLSVLNKIANLGGGAKGIFSSARARLGFSEGGVVPKYFANGGLARGTDTVPAMLTPGERVLSVNQNKAFEGGLGNIVININNPQVFSNDDIIEMVGDPIINVLKQHLATV